MKTQKRMKATEVEKYFENYLYVKVVEITYTVMQASFDNSLNQGELLHPDMKIYRKKIYFEEEVVEGIWFLF